MKTETDVTFALTIEDISHFCVSDYEDGRGAIHLRRSEGRFVISASLDSLETMADLILKKVALFRKMALLREAEASK